MAQQDDKTRVIDYSKWDNLVEDDYHVGVDTPFHSQMPTLNTTNLTKEDAERVKIPRSPRPMPCEPPVLASDGLLEPPPMNAPKGSKVSHLITAQAAAVRHYQIGFGHKVIKKKKNHRKAASMTVFDQMQEFLKEQEHVLKADYGDDSSHKTGSDKSYGIKVDQDGSELIKECGDLLQFMMNETAKEKARKRGDQHNDDDENGFSPSHHDYYKHNPHEYYRQQAMHNTRFGDHHAMDMTVDVVLKMGGAFLTKKDTLHCLREENIETAAKHIAEALKCNFSMILVHGAGSFGHFEAKQYKLNKGLFCDDSSKGMVLCRAAVSILHQNVMAKLMEYKVPVISVSPNGIVTSSDGVISRRQFKPMVTHLRRILKNGMVPLLHGDVIFDDKRGCHILSGDVIMEHLSAILGAQRAVFWSNIDGVYDCTDLDKEASLIRSVSVNAKGHPELGIKVLKQLKDPETFLKEQQDEYMKDWSLRMDQMQKKEAQGDRKEEEIQMENECVGGDGKKNMGAKVEIDVTGGMFKKVQVSARICALGTDVVITKGGTENARLALMGKCAQRSTVFVSTAIDESVL